VSRVSASEIALARLALVDRCQDGELERVDPDGTAPPRATIREAVELGFCPLCGAAPDAVDTAAERNVKGAPVMLSEFLDALAEVFAQAIREHPELARKKG
jgi:hypothetical protein